MNIRVSAEDAGWSIREAAWGFEERVLWRSSDAARGALSGVGGRMAPLQRLIQTKLTWPLGDAYRSRSRATRRALATGAVVVAAAAAGAGALSANGGDSRSPVTTPVAAATSAPAGSLVLQGVQPEFVAADNPAPAPPPAQKPSAPPARVAWQFAQAFVAYEVGSSSDQTAKAFNVTATPQLAKALSENPPRLPANGKVPKARVLNVVLGQVGKDQITASVSLVRMRTISEVRLTLQKDGDAWRVAQVLG